MSQTVGFHDGMKRFLQEMQFSMKKKKRFQSLKNSMFPQGHFLNRSLQPWSPFQSKRDSETRRGRGRGGAPGQRPKRIVSRAPCRRDAGPSRHREHILQGTKLFSLTSPGEARRHGVALGGRPRGGGGAPHRSPYFSLRGQKEFAFLLGLIDVVFNFRNDASFIHPHARPRACASHVPLG